MIRKQWALRITHGLRSGADEPRLRVYGGLGRSRCALAPTLACARIFAPLELLRNSFIAAQKRRKPFCYVQLPRLNFPHFVLLIAL
jgi:hypothetical protein